MGQYVGLDVSLETTKVHVLDDQGKRVWRLKHPLILYDGKGFCYHTRLL